MTIPNVEKASICSRLHVLNSSQTQISSTVLAEARRKGSHWTKSRWVLAPGFTPSPFQFPDTRRGSRVEAHLIGQLASILSQVSIKSHSTAPAAWYVCRFVFLEGRHCLTGVTQAIEADLNRLKVTLLAGKTHQLERRRRASGFVDRRALMLGTGVDSCGCGWKGRDEHHHRQYHGLNSTVYGYLIYASLRLESYPCSYKTVYGHSIFRLYKLNLNLNFQLTYTYRCLPQ
jgi:hypothetical protein